MSRRGFTLIELLVATVVMGILGVALARILISDSRFVSRQDAMLGARYTGRAALNLLDRELRMVEHVVAATPDSIVVLSPYAFGVTCRTSGVAVVVSLMPADSMWYANAVASGLSGFAWSRDTTTYHASGITVAASSDVARCSADGTQVLPRGRLVQVSGFIAAVPDSTRVGYLYQIMAYTFGPSADLPGRRALWRGVLGGSSEELAAPFDTSASFRCLSGATLAVQTCPPPGGLPAIRGIEIRLTGASEATPPGRDSPETFSLVTRIPFLNQPN